MDKNRMKDDKKWQALKAECEVHRMPKGIQQIHKDYGLWILHTGRGTSPIGGYHRTPKRYFEYYSISHLVKGDGLVWLHPGQEQDIEVGQCVVVCPNVINRYGGNKDVYKEDSICFTGPIADMMYKSGIIKTGIFDLGQTRKLLPIMEQAADPAIDAQLNANFALQKLFIDMYNEKKAHKNRRDSVIDELIAAMHERIKHWWTVQEMAEFCNLSDDQLRRVFLKKTGVRPKTYIDLMKMQRAANLLTSKQFDIAEIAEQLGYLDPYHFSRRFKKIMGFPPKKYRRIFGSVE